MAAQTVAVAHSIVDWTNIIFSMIAAATMFGVQLDVIIVYVSCRESSKCGLLARKSCSLPFVGKVGDERRTQSAVRNVKFTRFFCQAASRLRASDVGGLGDARAQSAPSTARFPLASSRLLAVGFAASLQRSLFCELGCLRPTASTTKATISKLLIGAAAVEGRK